MFPDTAGHCNLIVCASQTLPDPARQIRHVQNWLSSPWEKLVCQNYVMREFVQRGSRIIYGC